MYAFEFYNYWWGPTQFSLSLLKFSSSPYNTRKHLNKLFHNYIWHKHFIINPCEKWGKSNWSFMKTSFWHFILWCCCCVGVPLFCSFFRIFWQQSWETSEKSWWNNWRWNKLKKSMTFLKRLDFITLFLIIYSK